MASQDRIQRVFAYLPAADSFANAAKRIRSADATPVWQLDGSAASIGDVPMNGGDAVRLGVAASVPRSGRVSTVILAAEHALDEERFRSRIESLKEGGHTVYVEVVDVETAGRCQKWGADGLIACGFEAGGYVGEESGLVLLRRLYRQTSLPVVVRGAIGPDSAAAVIAAGASGYVLEHQLWLGDEFPISDKIERRLSTFNPADTRCLGVSLGFRYRVFAMIATRKPKELAEREVELVDAGATAGDLLSDIQRAAPECAWDFDLRDDLWALGQGAALARPLNERYGDTAGVISGIRSHVEDVLRGLEDDFPLQPEKGIAEVNDTHLPIHQGPMAQVADTPAFARAVSDGGALPWLALANMPTHIAEEIVDDTADELGDRPYGAGIIGLDANRYRDGHMEMMKQKRKEAPLLGLVAAGTAEQAMQFESADIRTYLHTPTPGVLRAALRSGHRKFLLEGAEAGGHVGTLGGLALWQYGILEIEEAIEDGTSPEEIAVVPAGGISDAASAAAVAALFFDLHRRGVNFGIQMGTAYLMTKEAVETGALSETFQEVAEQSDGTVIMGESVNTPTRVLSNSAADRVLQREKNRLTDGVDLDERKHLYERDNLGGLRAAAKGERIAEVDPDKGAVFQSISRDEQLDEGLFHCGQGVALCDDRWTIDQLHTEVTDNARRWIADRSYRTSFRPQSTDESNAVPGPTMTDTTTNSTTEIIDGDRAIAIVGIGAKMPGALDKNTFWENIVRGESAIGPVPQDRWDPALYFDPDPKAPDKTYSKIGGWVEDFEFDRRAFRVPPKVVESIDPTQLLCLEATREALGDAGYLDAEFDRDRCAVILGNALGGDLRDTTNQRILYPEVDRVLRNSLMELGSGTLSSREREELLETVEQRFKSEIVGINEDSMPGELANIVAGRVAQAFDLRGPNFITDAACASSLAALEAAVRGLRNGQFDMAVTGGADRSMGPPSYVKFSKIGALSPDGSRPFDADANGFVMGEGAGILILKRLSDAVADGDDVYAVVRGVGGSSDGRGKGITAPNPRGQKLAVKRAYEDAEFNPASISLLEAHGTSTPVGDPAEVQSMNAVLESDSSATTSDRIALGSVKSNIGHLKSAAGAAGIIKAAMALKHRVLPKTLNVTTPNPKLDIDDSALSIQAETEEWTQDNGAPRRAGVSSFGFGGTNFHVAMEEFLPSGGSTGRTTGFGETHWSGGFSGSGGAFVADIPAGEGIIAVAAADESELAADFAELKRRWKRDGESGIADWKVDFTDGEQGLPTGSVRLAIAYADADELQKKLDRTERALDGNMSWRVLANQGVLFADESTDGKVGMLFPGQGSQYLEMLSDLRRRFSVVDETFREADEIMEPVLGRKLSDIIAPDLDEVDENEAFRALTKTENTQPAVLTADIAMYRLLGELGIEPDMVAGHSLGEYGACVAAGVLTFEEALKTVATRGTAMSEATPMDGDPGLMAGISAPVEVVEPVLEEIDGYVVCANINCPSQTIIAGLSEAVEEAKERFEEMDYQVPLLPVSHAFHSKVVAAASDPLREHLQKMDVSSPEVPILTNVTGGFYPTGPSAPDEIRDQLSKQVASPVQFIDLIETMYDEGVRSFVEVGPKRAQTSFVKSILEDRDHLALYTNHPKKGGVTTLYEALATLWTSGVWGGVEEASERHEQITTPESPVTDTTSSSSANREEIVDTMMQVLCEKTGYDPAEIELDFELEADLGVDTVKQAEIMAEVREKFDLDRDEDFRLADYPTLDRMADYVVDALTTAQPTAEQQSDGLTPDAPPHDERNGEVPEGTEGGGAPTQTSAPHVDRQQIVDTMMQVLCEKTGYDPAEIELDFELEADLGVDTVKQAEIMAEVREKFDLDRDEDFRLADYPTLDRMADYVVDALSQTPPHDQKNGEISEEHHGDDHTPDAPPHDNGNGEVPKRSEGGGAPTQTSAPHVDRQQIVDTMMQVLCEKTGYDPAEIELDFELEADLGVDTVKQAEIMAEVREEFDLDRDEDFRLADYPTLDRMADYVVEALSATQPTAEQPSDDLTPDAPPHDKRNGEVPKRSEGGGAPTQTSSIATSRTTPTAFAEDGAPQSDEDAEIDSITQHDIEADAVISGCAVGLPGTDELFEEETIERLLEGTNFIDQLTEQLRESMVDKRITRLQKHEDGGGELVEVTDTEEVIKLAGQKGEFDLREWGVSDRLIEALDRTSQMAFAAGFEALRDAGLPLIPRYRETTTGKKVTTGWTLPEKVGDETGVIFASAFAGQDALIEELNKSHEEEGEYQFNHRFLLRVLGIANSRFAEYVGARGPNTKMNNACASTTTAVAMAQDWIRSGRCKRVIILSADDASGDELMEWVGSGFLATGAATTEENVEDAALPFDKRRHGMIVGMGALSLVVEESGLPEARGIEPIADVLTTQFVNSAFHPTRLDVDHIAGEVSELIGRAETDFEIDRSDIADRTVFISHETYTPARGGSAAAEISALREAFGDEANDVVIANTKGFTGHAMGAGIEDVLAMKVLQHERVPPIANFEQPDPDLGDLRLSDGGDYDVDYALRLAAGFGSQLALALFRFRARGEDRVFDARAFGDWLAGVSGFDYPELSVEDRVLRLRRGQPDDRPPSGGIEPDVPMEPNPFDFQPVAVRAHSAATNDVIGLRKRLEGRRVALVTHPGAEDAVELMKQAARRCGADVSIVEVADGELLGEPAFAEQLSRHGDVDGIVNLLGWGHGDVSVDEVYAAGRNTFHLAKAFAAINDGDPGEEAFFATLTDQGGMVGFGESSDPKPIAGAVGGFTKALSHEWSDAAVRSVDIQRDGLYPKLGLQIFDAVFDGGDWPEVGLVGGVCYLPVFCDVDDAVDEVDRGSFAPGSDSTIVVTGGAKGIGAEICVDLAERYGCNLALVGRSELTHSDPLSVDMAEEKERVRAELEQSGERVTPVKVRDALWPLKSQRKIQNNVVRMKEAGADVEYFSCDVADADGVRRLFDDVERRFGSVDGVIHGAGVEESKYVTDKETAGFDKVFCGKALGGLNLWDAVESRNPAFFVAFSSVAGRFGNEGQTDYSAANEVLSKLVARIDATTDTRALSIDWTAWGEVGMATGSMATILEARGVEFLPPERGAPMVAEAIENGLTGEAMVAGELGEMGGDLVVEMPVHPDLATDCIDDLALVGEVVERTDDRIVVEQTLDPDHDLFIDDHVYEGTPVFPGVMGYEMMADAAQVLTGRPVTEVKNADFDRALKIHNGEPARVTVTAERVGKYRVDTVLRSHRQSKTGRKLDKEHFRAEVYCNGGVGDVPAGFAIEAGDDARRGPKRAEIYRRFFHTGSFRVLDEVPVLSDDYAIGYGRVPGARLVDSTRDGGFVTDPLVREMALQTAGLWGMVENGLSYLPYGIGRSLQFRRAKPGEQISIRCRRRDDASEHAIAFDVEVRGADGELLQWFEKLELIGHQKLRDENRFGEFPAIWQFSERLTEPEAKRIVAERNLDAVGMLSDEETRAYRRLRSERRRGEWLAARIAARTVASRYFRDFFGKPIALDDIHVTKSESGKPSIVVESDDVEVAMLPLPQLALTHSSDIAVASVTLPERPHHIGVDLERIEERPDNFAESYFTDREQNLELFDGAAPAATQTALWTVKESVAKALGLGLELSTHEIAVKKFRSLGDERVIAEVELAGRAVDALQGGGGGQVHVELQIASGYALANARIDTDRPTPSRWIERDEKVNGRTNGAANGHANGANGHARIANGHANGKARNAVAELLGHRPNGRAADDENQPRSWTF